MKKLQLMGILVLGLFLVACGPQKGEAPREEAAYQIDFASGQTYGFSKMSLVRVDDEVQVLEEVVPSKEATQAIGEVLGTCQLGDPGLVYDSIPDSQSLVIRLETEAGTQTIYLYDSEVDVNTGLYHYTFDHGQGEEGFSSLLSEEDLIPKIMDLGGLEKK
ncbi:MAG: hypothetical protein Q4E37_03030 [Tissierellia bacterium]|nr:hypothetical protein [Tissierellia bacterium]